MPLAATALKPRPAGNPTADRLRVVDPVEDSGWERLVLGRSACTPFHGRAWARVLQRSYGHRPCYLVVDDGRGEGAEPAVAVPLMDVRSWLTGRRGVCLPFADCCPVLVAERVRDPDLAHSGVPSEEESPSISPELAASHAAGFRPSGPEPAVFGPDAWRQIVRLGEERGWEHLEFRGGPPPVEGARPSLAFHGHTLDLRPGEAQVFEGFSPAVRRALRKGGRSDVSLQVLPTLEAVHLFFELHALTRRRHGLPPQPFRFFLAIHDEFIARGQGWVALARVGRTPVAAAVFLRLGRRAVYKFGASDPSFQGLRTNNLVMWEAIRWLIREGAESLHLGRSSLRQEGLRRFKLGWGATEHRIPYYRYDLRRQTWVSAPDRAQGGHNRLFARLPLLANRLAGTLLYPHLD